VVDKASGILAQPLKDSNEPSTIELIRYYWKSKKIRPRYLGIVYRLDKETSGLMVLAKNKVVQRLLQYQFAHHKVAKRYLAIVDGIPNRTRDRLTGMMTRGIAGKRVIVHGTNQKGKEVITRFKVIEKFNARALLEVAPDTGRTHQIRVHLAMIGCPIVGEPVYSPAQKRVKGCARCALHASKLVFTHPKTAKRIEFEAPLPPDMQRIIQKERLANENKQ
jgi:23S rRNA pseudouridine1911/1915/1917 synthase